MWSINNGNGIAYSSITPTNYPALPYYYPSVSYFDDGEASVSGGGDGGGCGGGGGGFYVGMVENPSTAVVAVYYSTGLSPSDENIGSDGLTQYFH